MDAIRELANKYKLLVLEDAAQGFLAKYKGRYLGAIGDMAALSFHETKNIIAGEGGAILWNTYHQEINDLEQKGMSVVQ